MSVFYRFVFLLLFASISVLEAKKCPSADSTYPCQCSEPTAISTEKRATIYCERIDDLHTLRRVVTASGDYPFPKWELNGLFFNYVPGSALKLKSIRKLHISYSTFVGLFDLVPEENHKLHEIRIEHSKILRGIEWELFRNLHNLTDLIFHYVSMRKLGKEFQENVQPSLTNLELVNTNITKLGDEVFSNLTNLKHITIIDGKIQYLKKSMFPKVNSITDLRFDGHLIQNLPDGIFSDMSKLQRVSLVHNRLTKLPEAVFGVFRERNTELRFHENEIICDCEVRWITQKRWAAQGACATPHGMKGKEVLTLGDDLNYCDDL